MEQDIPYPLKHSHEESKETKDGSNKEESQMIFLGIQKGFRLIENCLFRLLIIGIVAGSPYQS